MKNTINSHFAVLIIVIAGAGAAWFIYHLATQSPLPTNFGGSEATYSPLQKQILEHNL